MYSCTKSTQERNKLLADVVSSPDDLNDAVGDILAHLWSSDMTWILIISLPKKSEIFVDVALKKWLAAAAHSAEVPRQDIGLTREL